MGKLTISMAMFNINYQRVTKNVEFSTIRRRCSLRNHKFSVSTFVSPKVWVSCKSSNWPWLSHRPETFLLTKTSKTCSKSQMLVGYIHDVLLVISTILGKSKICFLLQSFRYLPKRLGENSQICSIQSGIQMWQWTIPELDRGSNR